MNYCNFFLLLFYRIFSLFSWEINECTDGNAEWLNEGDINNSTDSRNSSLTCEDELKPGKESVDNNQFKIFQFY